MKQETRLVFQLLFTRSESVDQLFCKRTGFQTVLKQLIQFAFQAISSLW